jgi:predicted amidohydrolase YtcJ
MVMVLWVLEVPVFINRIMPKQYGALLVSTELRSAQQIANSEFQLNSHAIGDSANTVLLKIYKEALTGKKDRRWKIEHAQVLREQDFEYFKSGIIPSVAYTCHIGYVLMEKD